MKQDILDKGAIIQRDGELYGIAPHLPAGITDAATLRKIADIAERFGVAQIKLTSAQRIALLGLREDQLDAVWAELGEPQGAAIGLCVRSVKVCPGTDWCKRGQQDSVKVGLEVDRRYHGLALPWKCKFGVSGCANDCAEVCVKDLGLVGTPKGWHLYAGGNGGSQPRLARRLLEHIPTETEALAAFAQVVEWFQAQGRKCRVGKLVEELGVEKVRAEALPGWGGR